MPATDQESAPSAVDSPASAATEVEALAAYAVGTTTDALSAAVLDTLKRHLLDALGCAIGALASDPLIRLRRHVDVLGGAPRTTLIGGGRTAADRAAFFNGALVRYLDFNDSYLAPGETCHPSDNLGAVLAAVEEAKGTGADLLAGLAVAYQVQCRLSDEAPVRSRGFDHTTHLAYAAAAGASRGLRLSAEQAAQAIAMSGVSGTALRVTRTGHLSNWKGLASAFTGMHAVQAVLLARQGLTGPVEVFEGRSGFREVLAPGFAIDWSRESWDRVARLALKTYNADVHAQSALEAALHLRAHEHFDPTAIERVEVETFDVAFNIIGGGREGDKHEVETKEQADHSLPYLVAVALLDGAVGPAQYAPARIRKADVQALLRRVTVRPVNEFSARFPAEMPARIRITRNGRAPVELTVADYEGFPTRPMAWRAVTAKFDQLTTPHASPTLRSELVDVVRHLEEHDLSTLAHLLSQVSAQPGRGDHHG